MLTPWSNIIVDIPVVKTAPNHTVPYRTMMYHTVLYDYMTLKDYTHILAHEAYG